MAYSHTVEYRKGERTPTTVQNGDATCKHHVEEEREARRKRLRYKKSHIPSTLLEVRDRGLEGACDGLFLGFGAGFTNTFGL